MSINEKREEEMEGEMAVIFFFLKQENKALSFH